MNVKNRFQHNHQEVHGNSGSISFPILVVYLTKLYPWMKGQHFFPRNIKVDIFALDYHTDLVLRSSTTNFLRGLPPDSLPTPLCLATQDPHTTLDTWAWQYCRVYLAVHTHHSFQYSRLENSSGIKVVLRQNRYSLAILTYRIYTLAQFSRGIFLTCIP